MYLPRITIPSGRERSSQRPSTARPKRRRLPVSVRRRRMRSGGFSSRSSSAPSCATGRRSSGPFACKLPFLQQHSWTRTRSLRLTCGLSMKYFLARQSGTGGWCRGLHQLAHGRDRRQTGPAGRTGCVDALGVGCPDWARLVEGHEVAARLAAKAF